MINNNFTDTPKKRELYNIKALENKTAYIVPDEATAKTVEALGKHAIGLNGRENIKALINAVIERPETELYIFLDNIPVTGERELEELEQELQLKRISYKVIKAHASYNTPLDLYEESPEDFIKLLDQREQEEKPRERTTEDFIRENSVESLLNSMRGAYIEPRVKTGLPVLDKKLGGGITGLTVIGAAPSVGKTTLVNQIGDNIAESETPVLFITLEHTGKQLILKSLSRNSYMLKNPLTTQEISERLYREEPVTGLKEYSEKVKDNVTYIDSLKGPGTESIREYARAIKKAKKKAPVIVIDYLQLLAVKEGRLTEKQNNDKAIAELKEISRELETPVIVISALNREGCTKPVTMQALKESSSIEYTADIVLGLQYKGITPDADVKLLQDKNPRELELAVLKNREAQAGTTINLFYNSKYNTFEDKEPVKRKQSKMEIIRG